MRNEDIEKRIRKIAQDSLCDIIKIGHKAKITDIELLERYKIFDKIIKELMQKIINAFII